MIKLAATFLALIGLSLHPSVGSAVAISCGDAYTAVALLPEKEQTILQSPVDAWLEIRETGQQIRVEPAGAGEILQIPVPLRFGRYWLHVGAAKSVAVARLQANRARGFIDVRWHCLGAGVADDSLKWERRAATIAGRLGASVGKDEFSALEMALHDLQDAARGPDTRALAEHMLAQALLVNDRNLDAAARFAIAEQRWIDAGDLPRALVARVARAEDERRTSNYEEAIRLTMIPPAWPQSVYFAIRLQNTRCLSLNYLGRYAESDACYTETLRRLEEEDERGEVVDTLYDYALLLTNRGLEDDAMRTAQRALRAAAGIDLPFMQGHVRYMLEWLSYRRGDLAQSLAFANEALAFFTKAGMPRWQANVLFDVSNLYLAMGAYDEALGALGQAMSHITYNDAPARVAVGMLMFARIEYAQGFLNSAALWSTAARSLFEQRKMPAERDTAELLMARVSFDLGGSSALVEQRSKEPGGLTPQWQLLALRAAMQRLDAPAARALLDALHDSRLTLADQIDTVLLEARWHELTKDPRGAQRIIEGAASHWNELMARARSPVVRHLVSRQILPLRRADIDLLLADAAHASALEVAESMLFRLQTPSLEPDDESSSAVAAAFDRNIAREMLTPSASRDTSLDDDARKQLLAILAAGTTDSESPRTKSESVDLAHLQASLPADTMLVAFMAGNRQAGLLRITRDVAVVGATTTARSVRNDALALRLSARSLQSSVREIDENAARLSADLFGAMPIEPAPRRLMVVSDPALAGTPWTLLHWPNHAQPLIDDTVVSIVSLQRMSDVAKSPAPPRVHLYVANGSAALAPGLSELADANAEAEQIRDILAVHDVAPLMGRRATRAAVLTALHEPGVWVHVAAHGIARAERIGYAGIWLDPEHDGAPMEFLSWIDLLQRGVHADLVVLDACQLGDSGAAIEGALSFAEAAAGAGAGHVVAAMWPVSDAAALVWTPQFYRALAVGQERDPAAALRAAQLRLRETREFTHPFYWAGLQEIEHLPSRRESAQKSPLLAGFRVWLPRRTRKDHLSI